MTVVDFEKYKRKKNKEINKFKFINQKQKIAASYDWAELAQDVMVEQLPKSLDKNAIYYSFLRFAANNLEKNGWKKSELVKIILE